MSGGAYLTRLLVVAMCAGLCAFAGCTPVKRQAQKPVHVSVDAAPAVRGELTELTVTIEWLRDSTWELAYATPIDLRSAGWPVIVDASVPNRAARHQVTATARANGVIAGEVRVIVDSVDELSTIRLILDEACARRPPCGRSLTCVDGECMDARRVAVGESAGARATRDCAGANANAGACATSARCDGGTCQATAALETECEQRSAGAQFCDADGKLVTCQADSSFVSDACPSNQQCVDSNEPAHCVCRTGFVPQAGGDCVEARDCSGRGGCDPVTECQIVAGERTCTACPPGYEGTGESGCAAQVRALRLSAGRLEPLFDPNVHEYRALLPGFETSLSVTVELDVPAQLTLNEQRVEAGTPWTMPVIIGRPDPIEIVLRTEAGVRSDYRVIVDRQPVEQLFIKAPKPAEDDQFGGYVAAYGDIFVVGAPFERGDAADPNTASPRLSNAGAVHVYVKEGDGFRHQAYLKAAQIRQQDYFGSCVSIWKDRIAVGAPGDLLSSFAGAANGVVHTFVRQGDSWVPEQVIPSGNATTGTGDGFGFRVALREDTLFVGAPLDDDGAVRSGAAYVYVRDASGWKLEQRLKAPTNVSESRYGSAIAIDAQAAVVGAFSENHGGFTRAGAAYVYTRGAGGAWSEGQRLTAPTPRQMAQYGGVVDLQDSTLVVAAPHNPLETSSNHNGEVHVYSMASGAPQHVQTVTAGNPLIGDEFGSHVALRDQELIVGAPGESIEHGSIYMFVRDGAAGFLQSTSTAPVGADGKDYFGYVVAIGDGFAVTGAPQEDSGSPGIGADPADNSARESGAIYVLR
jgi:hypothetical protein